MMAKTIRALELHNPMIQFLIITITYSNICIEGCAEQRP